jgi:hypothetical protein
MIKVIDFATNLSKKGNIFIGSKDNYFFIDADLYYLCTTYANNVPEGTVLKQELSPSFKLFLEKQALLNDNIFVQRYSYFASAYISEINTRSDCIQAICELESLLKQGKKIVLFDDCCLKEYCHLNILGRVLINKGFKVEFLNGKSTNFNF